MSKRILRICPRDPAQDGVCGCDMFWKRVKKSLHKDKASKATTRDSTEAVDAAQPSEREAKKKKGQRKKKRNKKAAKKATQILVDYDLPSGNRRMSWDTDEVRKMAGEIS